MFVETKDEYFCTFFFHPYDAFNICTDRSDIRSWIIEHLLMHEQDDAYALLNDQGIFLM
jgi:hypothetical protein